MGNLTVHDYNEYERATLSDTSALRKLSSRGERLLTAYSIAAAAVLAGLTYSAVLIYDGWHHAVVIGVGLVTFYAVCRWVWPERKRNY